MGGGFSSNFAANHFFYVLMKCIFLVQRLHAMWPYSFLHHTVAEQCSWQLDNAASCIILLSLFTVKCFLTGNNNSLPSSSVFIVHRLCRLRVENSCKSAPRVWGSHSALLSTPLNKISCLLPGPVDFAEGCGETLWFSNLLFVILSALHRKILTVADCNIFFFFKFLSLFVFLNFFIY